MKYILGSAVLDCCELWFLIISESDFKSCRGGSIFSPPNCERCTQNINIPFWRLFQDFLLSHRINRWISLSAAVTHNHRIKESVFSKWSLFWQATKSHLTRAVTGMICVRHGSTLNRSYAQRNHSRTKTVKDYVLEIQFAQALHLHMWLHSEYGQWLCGAPHFHFHLLLSRCVDVTVWDMHIHLLHQLGGPITSHIINPWHIICHNPSGWM